MIFGRTSFKEWGSTLKLKIFNTIILLTTFPVAALANTGWETLISCDGGKFLLETQCTPFHNSPCYYQNTQMIIRNPDIQNYFANSRAFGYYSDPGHFFGQSGNRFPEMLIHMNGYFEWGMSGSYDYTLFIPFQDSKVEIKYYLNYLDSKSIAIKAVAHSDSLYGIVKAGDLASWTYHDCWISEKTATFGR